MPVLIDHQLLPVSDLPALDGRLRFVFYLGLGGPLQGPGGGALVSVGPHRFGLREFERIEALRLDNWVLISSGA